MPEPDPPNELMSRVTNITVPKGLVQAVENESFTKKEVVEEKIERAQAKAKKMMRFMINRETNHNSE